jgi:hypothetical protein
MEIQQVDASGDYLSALKPASQFKPLSYIWQA